MATSAYQMVSLLMEAKPGGTTLTSEKAIALLRSFKGKKASLGYKRLAPLERKLVPRCTSELNLSQRLLRHLQVDRGTALAPPNGERKKLFG